MSVIGRYVGAALVSVILLALAPSSRAAETNIAVAANFTEAAKEIAAAWEKASGHKAVLSFGATGQLFTQISQGAPYDVFLSADQATAKKAGDDGFGTSETQFTYAVGKLALFSKNKDAVKGERTLSDSAFDKIAIANPTAAPYGVAAIETMKALGVYEKLAPKSVYGQNITQTYQFVDTGNAEVGFVALSQVLGTDIGSRWIVSERLYSPIKQDAILLKKGGANVAAKDFIAFLKGPEAAKVKEKYGYGPGE
jgi:molybdate transport system substrate-binding protein